jgi:hypothetical protein
MKSYNSFKELDQDLKLLKVQAQISTQKVNIDIAYIKRAFAFTNIIAEVISYLGQKTIYARIGTQILRKFGL